MLRLAEMLAKTEPMVKCNGTPFGTHFTAFQRFVSSTRNMEVLLSHTHSIVCALAYFEPFFSFKNVTFQYGRYNTLKILFSKHKKTLSKVALP